MQTTNKVFMVRPVKFTYNEQTATNNEFQNKDINNDTQIKALNEFDAYVSLLKENGVEVVVVNDTLIPHTPDSIFPNNWFSTHENGTLVLYSMCAENRRQERKQEFLKVISDNFKVNDILDLSVYEKQNKFLEGTGSMVLDRENKIIYACRSIRTSTELLEIFAKNMHYKLCCFEALSQNNIPIYHTNVMMSLGKDFAVICLEAIKNQKEKNLIINNLLTTNKEIVDISYKQLNCFAGNILELRNNNNERLLIMSACAKKAFTGEQLSKLTNKCKIISPDISTIENIGGGSARCMLAELF